MIAAQAEQCGPSAAVHTSSARYIHVDTGAGEFVTLHFDWFRCADRGLICGPEGCLHEVFAPVAGHYRLIFNARVRDLEFAVVNGRVVVRVECTRSGARHCPRDVTWNGTQLAETP